MRQHHLATDVPFRHLAVAAAATIAMLIAIEPAVHAQQKPTRAIALALESVTLEFEPDGTLTRIESRATEPVMTRGAEAETETIRKARERVMAQLSRFLANEQGASQALQQSLARLTPPLNPDAANRLMTGLGTVARTYRARTLPPAKVSGTKSSDGMIVALTATVSGPFVDAPAVNAGAAAVPGGVQGGSPGAVLGGVVGGLPHAPPPPPPAPNSPIKLGDNVTPPTKTKHVAPVYPPIAQSARVTGTVSIEVTIGVDGKVKDAKVLKSIPLLDQAALDAVKQWEFTPTLLNGVAVPVIIAVTVNFTLQ